MPSQIFSFRFKFQNELIHILSKTKKEEEKKKKIWRMEKGNVVGREVLVVVRGEAKRVVGGVEATKRCCYWLAVVDLRDLTVTKTFLVIDSDVGAS